MIRQTFPPNPHMQGKGHNHHCSHRNVIMKGKFSKTKVIQNRKTNRNADCRISPPPLPFPPQKHTWSGLRRRARQQMTSCTGAGLRSNICSIQNAPATSQSLMKYKSHRGIGESRYLSVFVPSYHFLTHTHIDKQSNTHHTTHSHTCTSYEIWHMA